MVILFLIIFYGVYIYFFSIIFQNHSPKTRSGFDIKRYIRWFLGYYKESLKKDELAKLNKKNGHFWLNSDY